MTNADVYPAQGGVYNDKGWACSDVCGPAVTRTMLPSRVRTERLSEYLLMWGQLMVLGGILIADDLTFHVHTYPSTTHIPQPHKISPIPHNLLLRPPTAITSPLYRHNTARTPMNAYVSDDRGAEDEDIAVVPVNFPILPILQVQDDHGAEHKEDPPEDEEPCHFDLSCFWDGRSPDGEKTSDGVGQVYAGFAYGTNAAPPTGKKDLCDLFTLIDPNKDLSEQWARARSHGGCVDRLSSTIAECSKAYSKLNNQRIR